MTLEGIAPQIIQGQYTTPRYPRGSDLSPVWVEFQSSVLMVSFVLFIYKENDTQKQIYKHNACVCMHLPLGAPRAGATVAARLCGRRVLLQGRVAMGGAAP